MDYFVFHKEPFSIASAINEQEEFLANLVLLRQLNERERVLLKYKIIHTAFYIIG